VKAGFYILLTSYGDLYANDYMLPTGNLRESRSGAKRANIIIVTKCPSNLSIEEQNQIKIKLKAEATQKIYFSSIQYDDFVYSDKEKKNVTEIFKTEKTLLAGIAKPLPFFDYLKSEKDECLKFPDHHHFSDNEILEIKNKAKGKIIITTEKDYMRLKDSILKPQLYYLPIKSEFLSEKESFDEMIMAFCEE
jgi:tetraacyldisaccharide 4'-kinase